MQLIRKGKMLTHVWQDACNLHGVESESTEGSSSHLYIAPNSTARTVITVATNGMMPASSIETVSALDRGREMLASYRVRGL